MIHTFSRTAPAGEDPDSTIQGLRYLLLGEATLTTGFDGRGRSHSWDETHDERAGTVTVTYLVDDDPRAE